MLLGQGLSVHRCVGLVPEVGSSIEKDDEAESKEEEVAVDDEGKAGGSERAHVKTFILEVGVEEFLAVDAIVVDESVAVDEPANLEKEEPDAEKDLQFDLLHGWVLRCAPEVD